MSNPSFSRRNFLTTLASTAAAAAIPEAASGLTNKVAISSEITGASERKAGKVKILCTQSFSAQELAEIKAASDNIHLVLIKNQDEIRNHPDAEVILGSIDGSRIAALKNLKWVQTFAAGVENLPKELKEHSCTLTNMQRVFAPVIAETAIALLLCLTRGLAQVSIPAFAEKKWRYPSSDTPLTDLYGKTVGIVGMGGIGSETARRLHYGFNMRVLATDAKALPKPDFVAELKDPGWLQEMVPQVDVLMSAAPLTPQTKAMFNNAIFSKMKPSAYFINVSRGGLVDQEALVKALKEKTIRGAGLDVASPEPLPADHALWTCPNLVITPHNSTVAPARQIRAMALVVENVRRYANSLPLMNVVDKVKGY